MAAARFINPPTLAKAPGYTHTIEVTGPGRLIYIAGQLGTDLSGQVVAADFRSQAVQTWENVKAALAAADARMEDLIKINIYVVDLTAHLADMRAVREQYLNMKAPPASTAVGVTALARPGALIEIEGVAALPAR
jgi:enamine deaminase RidA (YjgF/YER057c/UK114 family)